jgi:endoglucanase
LPPARCGILAAIAAFAAIAVHTLGFAPPGALAGAGPSAAGAGGNPFSGAALFVDPDSNARRQAAAWRRSSPRRAALMDRIARQPQADWFVGRGPVGAAVRARVSRIRRAGALPVLVAYGIPFRDCGQYSRGGAPSARAYRRWITAFARGIGGRRAAVVLEPDWHEGLDCLPEPLRAQRLALIRFAVGVLTARPNVSLYVDAGHSRWHPVSRMAARLRAVGAGRARGVSLNVSNFRFDATEVRYGRALEASIPGLHVVIDSSRNGRGPAGTTWCNPPGRGLGRRPQAVPGDGLVDAYLWIKPPGESDGTCRGGPPAGVWWPSYALGLARRAR